jgi:hypothetical protein
MRPAALGIRAHSGWAAVVAVAGNLTPKILERRPVAVVDASLPGAKQPYHFARTLSLSDAEAHIAQCAKTGRLLAAQGVEAIAKSLRSTGYEIAGCGVLTSSGRAVPALAEVLASHAMIHTAEGEFFRNMFADACLQFGIPVTRVRERELLDRAAEQLRMTSAKIRKQLITLGRDLGPPWAQDQKNAALVAWLLLRSNTKGHS